MHKIHALLSVNLFFCALFGVQEKNDAQRNPFSFSSSILEKNTKKAPVEIKEAPKLDHEEIALLSTETKWHVKTVLPSSVIMQHKEDGQIREISLTGTHVS
jgi:hypothetical protein